MTRGVAVELFKSIQQHHLLAVQGRSKGGYAILQNPIEGYGEAVDSLRGMIPEYDAFLRGEVHDIAAVLHVSRRRT